MIYTISSNEIANGCESQKNKDIVATVDSSSPIKETGVLSIDAKFPKQKDETGVNELIDKMLKSKPAILTVGDNLDFSSIKENLNKNPINNLEKYHPDIIINNRDGDNMSAVIMYFKRNEGAILVSDSRVTLDSINGKPISYSDDKIKIYQNENTIVALIGLYTRNIGTNKIELGQPVINSILAGNTVETAINQTINGKKIYEYLEKDNMIIFYARTNGDIGVYNIFSNENAQNTITDALNDGYVKYVPQELEDVYTGLLNNTFASNYEGFEFKEARLKSTMKMLITIEQEREKLHLGISTIGGPVQSAVIKFNN